MRVAAGASLIGAGGVVVLSAVQQRSSLIAITIVLGLAATVGLLVGAGPADHHGRDEFADDHRP